MKKIALSLILSFVFCVGAFGASNDDIYLRKDAFDAKIEALCNRLHNEIQILSQNIDVKSESLDYRIKDSRLYFYLIIILLVDIIFQNWVNLHRKTQEKAVQPFTLDDVKKLIDEAIKANNNMILQGK